jgi:hypothetical protein
LMKNEVDALTVDMEKKSLIIAFTDCIDSCKSNYHTNTTTMTPLC